MIRTLRKKFILIAMISLLCVTAVLVTAINVTNLLRMDRRAEDLLDMISALRIPEKEFRPDPDREDLPDKPMQDEPWFSGKRGDFKSISITPETEFTTRWFSVTFSGGEVVSSSVEKIASLSSAQAEEYARSVLASGDRTGYYEGYKYRFVSENQTETVYFLNCETEIQGCLFLLVATVLIGVVCLFVLLVLITLLSRRAVTPVIENMERQKQFITDAGHELKTPLAIISANADVLSLTGEENEWVDSIRKQTDRMGHLVQDLLTLARSEEMPESDWALFDLSAAVTDTAVPFETLAESRGKGVRVDVQPGILFRGDEGALRRLVSILMENALKYAAPDSEIFLSLRKENKKILIQQTNFCNPLPSPEEAERWFDRFYRGDPSRSRERGGYGIGLSIARGIVTSHKGRISAAVADGKICFTVVF